MYNKARADLIWVNQRWTGCPHRQPALGKGPPPGWSVMPSPLRSWEDNGASHSDYHYENTKQTQSDLNINLKAERKSENNARSHLSAIRTRSVLRHYQIRLCTWFCVQNQVHNQNQQIHHMTALVCVYTQQHWITTAKLPHQSLTKL